MITRIKLIMKIIVSVGAVILFALAFNSCASGPSSMFEDPGSKYYRADVHNGMFSEFIGNTYVDDTGKYTATFLEDGTFILNEENYGHWFYAHEDPNRETGFYVSHGTLEFEKIFERWATNDGDRPSWMFWSSIPLSDEYGKDADGWIINFKRPGKPVTQ